MKIKRVHYYVRGINVRDVRTVYFTNGFPHNISRGTIQLGTATIPSSQPNECLLSGGRSMTDRFSISRGIILPRENKTKRNKYTSNFETSPPKNGTIQHFWPSFPLFSNCPPHLLRNPTENRRLVPLPSVRPKRRPDAFTERKKSALQHTGPKRTKLKLGNSEEKTTTVRFGEERRDFLSPHTKTTT